MSSSPLIFYTNPQSRGRMVRWALEEIGTPYDTVLVAYGDAMKAPEFLAINPMGKVPALRHGDVTITETGAIIAYLADAFPNANLAPPPGDPLRGTYLRWMFFAAGPLEEATNARNMGWEIPPDKRRSSGFGEFARVLDALEEAIAPGPHVLGEQFSAADIYFGQKIAWCLMTGLIDTRPSFQTYVECINARPAAKRAARIDTELAAAARTA